jgi:uncharacterized membrane protein
MMPLLVLLLSYLLLLLVSRFYRDLNRDKAGRLAFGFMFIFTGISHFTFSEGMLMSMPDALPFKLQLVYMTGILELLLAVAFTVGTYKRQVAFLIISFLILVFPANVWAAIHHVDIPNATYSGPGLAYLWFRVPLQLFFIVWVYYFGVKSSGVSAENKGSIDPLQCKMST